MDFISLGLNLKFLLRLLPFIVLAAALILVFHHTT